jgi:hypothetical protein
MALAPGVQDMGGELRSTGKDKISRRLTDLGACLHLATGSGAWTEYGGHWEIELSRQRDFRSRLVEWLVIFRIESGWFVPRGFDDARE